MRHGILSAVVAAMFATGCTSSEPLRDMIGYVPPTSLPAQPKRTLVADDNEQVWLQLIDFLEASAFDIDHIDEENNFLVARFSGNPEPYIDCGSIVTHHQGTLEQISGSASTVALNYEVDQEPVFLNRLLSLDSRIIIRIADQPQGTVIDTDTTYVVTKTVNMTDLSGDIHEGSRETVSFKAGNRGEFSKGTTCQPNGSLDLAVLKSLPNIVGTDEIDRAAFQDATAPVIQTALNDDVTPVEPQQTLAKAVPDALTPANEDSSDVVETDSDGAVASAALPKPDDDNSYDWVLPEQGLPTAALPAPNSTIGSLEQPAERSDTPSRSAREDWAQKDSAALAPDLPPVSGTLPEAQSPSDIVDDTTRKLLDSLDCNGAEWHFCDLVELTTPYRKRNIEELFGLTINTTGSFASQIIGNDLELDILFPSFTSNLHIAYARRDGTIEHLTSSSDVWPADLPHQLAGADRAIPGPAGLAMIVAIASEQPLFSSPPDELEDAAAYLDRLKQRLTELEGDDPEGSIAASQLLIYVENADI